MVIHWYVDEIFSLLLEHLDLKSDDYNPESDPVKRKGLLEWTIADRQVTDMKKKYEECIKSRKLLGQQLRKRKIEKQEEAEASCKKLENDDKEVNIKCEVAPV